MVDKVSILVVDDHTIVREGLKALFDEQPDMHIGATAGSLADARQLLRTQRFDVVVVDINLGDASGWELLKLIRTLTPRPGTLVLSAYPEAQFAVQALKAGADGYLNKGCPTAELLAAVRRVAAGRKYASPEITDRLARTLGGDADAPLERLSNREFHILRAIAMGKSLVAIAEELSISPKTVTTYRQRLMEKLELDNNAAIARYAMEHGLI